MLNPAHILEIALLLLVAFLIGAAIGSLARLVVLRLARPKPVAAAVAAAAPAATVAPALVTAPTIEPMSIPATPVAPANVEAPDFREALLALTADAPMPEIRMPSMAPLPVVEVKRPAAEMAPARAAGETTSGRSVMHPQVAASPARAPATPLGVSADVIPFRVEKPAPDTLAEPVTVAVVHLVPEVMAPEPAVLLPALASERNVETAVPELEGTPVAEPAVVAIKELAPEIVAADIALAAAEGEDEHHVTVVPEAAKPAQDVAAIVDQAVVAVAMPELEVAAANPVVEVVAVVPESVGVAEVPISGVSATVVQEPEVAAVVEVVAEPVAVATEPTPVHPAVLPEASDEDDEAAAMRAIEGNWSPRRGAGGASRKVAPPDGVADAAVAASGAAVASAVQAANAAVAETPEDAPGKPVGLAAPRHGGADDLTNVIGILPIIETALYRLGLYHFDQIADLSDDNAGWIETHLGIAGRIRREHWREQARELGAAMATSKKVAGQQ